MGLDAGGWLDEAQQKLTTETRKARRQPRRTTNNLLFAPCYLPAFGVSVVNLLPEFGNSSDARAS